MMSEHHTGLGGSDCCCLAEDLVKLEGAEIGKDEEHGDEQTKIADAVGDEGFFGSVALPMPSLPFSNQKPISR